MCWLVPAGAKVLVGIPHEGAPLVLPDEVLALILQRALGLMIHSMLLFKGKDGERGYKEIRGEGGEGLKGMAELKCQKL